MRLRGIERFLDDIFSDFRVVGIGFQFVEDVKTGGVRTIERKVNYSIIGSSDLADDGLALNNAKFAIVVGRIDLLTSATSTAARSSENLLRYPRENSK